MDEGYATFGSTRGHHSLRLTWQERSKKLHPTLLGSRQKHEIERLKNQHQHHWEQFIVNLLEVFLSLTKTMQSPHFA